MNNYYSCFTIKSFFLFLLIIISIVKLQAQGEGEVPDQIEFLALKDLYFTLGGASWNNATNWPAQASWPSSATAAEMGTWYGIRQEDGDIVEIYMDNNNLSGTIPASLSNLKNLLKLQISGSPQVKGTIPPELGDLPHLESFYLFSTALEGKIPSTLGKLRTLTHFGLTDNQLKGEIPSSIGDLVNLVELQLNKNQLSGNLPSSLIKLSQLVTIDLRENRFSGSIAVLTSLPSLRNLYLTNNAFSGSLPEFTSNSLYDLQLSDNDFSGAIPASISNLQSVRYLVMINNRFSGAIPGAINNLPALYYLDLRNNEINSVEPLAYTCFSRGGLDVFVSNNRLDFSYLEAFIDVSSPSYGLDLNPQKEIKVPAKMGFNVNAVLTIPLSSNAGQFSTISWEKLNGTQWNDVSSSNEDATMLTYKRSNAIESDAGTYRWKMTNSKVTGITLYSTPITVDTNIKMTLDNYAFQYKYDGRKRMTQKKVPGADWVYMVYDDRDRLVLIQDGEQRKSNKWTFTKYDALNRPVMTGSYAFTGDQAAMQNEVNTFYAGITNPITDRNWFETFNGSGNNHGYNDQSFPKSIPYQDYLTITYYDSYDFKNRWGAEFEYKEGQIADRIVNGSTYEQPDEESTGVIGQVTGSKVKTLDIEHPSNFKFLKSITYYDDKYRAVQNVSDNNQGGIDRSTSLYDFVGKVLVSKASHETRILNWMQTDYTTTTANSLTSTIGGYGSIPQSVQKIPARTDGYLEFKIGQLDGVSAEIMLSSSNSTENFGIYISQTSSQIRENYSHIAFFNVAHSSDNIYRIQRSGTTVSYYVNGSFQISSNVSSTEELSILAQLNSYISVQDIRTSFSLNEINFTEREFTYDHAGRLLTTKHSIDGATPLLLSKNEYNELGQLIDKNLHSTDGTTFKQSTDYRYNIRGWLTSINNAELTTGTGTNNEDNGNMGRDLFGMELAYEKEVTGLTSVANNEVQYNGNISAITYSNNLALGSIKSNGYKFGYDPMNRLKESNFRQKKLGTWAMSDYVVMDENDEPQTLSMEAFSERGFNYDLNGNIQELQRSGAAGSQKMDDLDYVYDGNQLISVNDKSGADKDKGFIDGNLSGDDYRYDLNGNMIADANKSIASITYNHLNLPEKVTKSSGEFIKYLYDATGRKVSQQVYGPSNNLVKKSDYAGEYFYENDTLKFINHEEGRVVLDRDYSQPELVASFDGSTPSAFFLNVGIPGTLSSEQQGGQTYLKFTNATFHWAGPLTNSVAVKAGETYKLRTQGYTTQPDVYVYIMGGDGSDVLWPGANLPLGASNEAWMENTFVVPVGMDHVYLGVIFGDAHPSSEDAFYINTIELYKVTNPGPTITNEYQYHLKDHLGNVRTTFTTKEEVEETIATLEAEYENTERSQYLKYDDTRRVFDHLFDHTHGVNTSVPSNTPGYSLRLNGSSNERNGLARSVSVMPGDKIDVQVFGKYIDPNTPHTDQTAWNNLLAFAADVATAAQTIVIDGVGYTSGTLRLPPYSGVLTDQNESASYPKAHLNWAIFDRNDKFLDGGAKQLQGGAEDGTDVLFGEINASIDINEPGYMYIWLSNTNAQVMDVYFDDFKVTHTKSPVIESQDFYPFGLVFNNYQRENSLINKFKFQSQEHVDDLGLNWDSFKWRNHQPDIGRFFNVDPLAEKYVYNSPYAFSENKVVAHVELEGLEAADAPAIKKEDPPPATNPTPPPALVNAVSAFISWLGEVGSPYTILMGNKDATDSEKAQAGAMVIAGLATAPMEQYQMLAEGGEASEAAAAVSKIDDVKPLVSAAKTTGSEMTTVGRWMSKVEYETMIKTGKMVEGAGGQTFVATGGPNAFTSAAKGSVYAEFQVSPNSLLQGGQSNWFKAIGPSAGKAMQGALQKQGGQLLPPVQNLSPILKVK